MKTKTEHDYIGDHRMRITHRQPDSPADWSLQKRHPDHRGTTWMFILTAVGSISGVIAAIMLGAWIDAHPYIVATVVLGLAGVAFIFIHRLEKKWKKK